MIRGRGVELNSKSATGVRELQTRVRRKRIGDPNKTHRHLWQTCAKRYHQFRGYVLGSIMSTRHASKISRSISSLRFLAVTVLPQTCESGPRFPRQSDILEPGPVGEYRPLAQPSYFIATAT